MLTRRATLFGAAASTLLLGVEQPDPPADMTQRKLPPRAFGLHVNNASPNGIWRQPQTPFPDIGERAIRLWQSYTTWALLNPAPGRFEWSRLDYLVSQNNSHGCDTMLTLGESPNWATTRTDNPRHNYDPPAVIADWTNYVRAVAERYRGRIAFYEPWNEPDVGGFNGTPEQLVELARAAYQTIKAADPAATVLTPAFTSGPIGPNRRTTLPAYLDSGGGQWCDGFAVHAYPGDGLRPETIPHWLDATKALAGEHGLGHLPIYDTESGARGWRDESGTLHNISPRFNDPLPTAGIDLQSAYVTRHLLCVLGSGVVQRSYWFTFEFAMPGGRADSVMAINMVDYPLNPDLLLPPAAAYRFLATLLTGGSLSRLRRAADHFEVDFVGPGGRPGTAYWCDDYATDRVSDPASVAATDNLGTPLPRSADYALTGSPIFVYHR